MYPAPQGNMCYCRWIFLWSCDGWSEKCKVDDGDECDGGIGKEACAGNCFGYLEEGTKDTEEDIQVSSEDGAM